MSDRVALVRAIAARSQSRFIEKTDIDVISDEMRGSREALAVAREEAAAAHNSLSDKR